MSNFQGPPITTTPAVNDAVLIANTGSVLTLRLASMRPIEEPPSFGVTQESIEAEMSCG